MLTHRSFIMLIRLALLGAAAGTLACALTPLASHLPVAGYWDKLNHGFAFAVLAVLCGLAFPQIRARFMAPALLAFGALIEVLQAIPAVHRSAEFGDLLADAAGVAVGFALVNALRLISLRSKAAPVLEPAAVQVRSDKAS